MQKGDVQAVLAAHYLPEKWIKEDWKIVAGNKVLKQLIDKYVDKIEKENAFEQTIQMINDFEKLFTEKDEAAVAHNYGELEKALMENKQVFVHTIEGGHHLGRGLSVDEYKNHIAQFSSKGVAMLTLNHFFPNDITTPTEGIPPSQKKLLGMQYVPQSSPLTDTGKEIVEALLESNIIVDLTHTNEVARKEIFAINERKLNKPLVFSHTGVRPLFKDKEHPHFSLISPDDDELLQIKRCGGVVGIVFMNYFLNGREEKPARDDDRGLKLILATIKHIADVTGSFDNIVIGTDFDGMSDPPDDCYDYTLFPNLDNLLHDQKGYLGATEADIEKIKSGNILRVLKEVWK
jgi:microsomal dipeptidase-like Zn-dependent dipeptidase